MNTRLRRRSFSFVLLPFSDEIVTILLQMPGPVSVACLEERASTFYTLRGEEKARRIGLRLDARKGIKERAQVISYERKRENVTSTWKHHHHRHIDIPKRVSKIK